MSIQIDEHLRNIDIDANIIKFRRLFEVILTN